MAKKVCGYLVVSVGIRSLVVGVGVIDDAGFCPHMPVRLYFQVKRRAGRARVLVAPRTVPADMPQGCVS